jgi:hypothetical protein
MATHPLDAPPESPTSVLHLLDRVLGDKDRTTNAKELLCSGAKAVSRILLSVTLALFMMVALTVTLIHAPGLSSAVGCAVVAGGTGLAWRAHVVRKRLSAKKR